MLSPSFPYFLHFFVTLHPYFYIFLACISFNPKPKFLLLIPCFLPLWQYLYFIKHLEDFFLTVSWAWSILPRLMYNLISSFSTAITYKQHRNYQLKIAFCLHICSNYGMLEMGCLLPSHLRILKWKLNNSCRAIQISASKAYFFTTLNCRFSFMSVQSECEIIM